MTAGVEERASQEKSRKAGAVGGSGWTDDDPGPRVILAAVEPEGDLDIPEGLIEGDHYPARAHQPCVDDTRHDTRSKNRYLKTEYENPSQRTHAV